MQKWITLLMTLCASYGVASDSGFLFEAGYRVDNLSWNVQSPAQGPLAKVSDSFDNVSIFQLGVKARTNVCCNLYLRGSFDIGWVLDGDYENKTRLYFIPGSTSFYDDVDFDGSYAFDNDNVVDGRFVLDADIALGYPCYFCDCQAYIAPVVGYAFNEQSLFSDDNATGFGYYGGDGEYDHDYDYGNYYKLYYLYPDHTCCPTKFISKWYGPFIGLDFKYDPCTCWKTYASFEYHWVGQKTKRYTSGFFSDFDDWDHHYNNARGYVFNLGIVYDWCQCWSLGLDFVYRDFVGHRHHHFDNEVFSSDFFRESLSFDDNYDYYDSYSSYYSGNSCKDDCSFKTKTRWRSYALSVTVDRCF